MNSPVRLLYLYLFSFIGLIITVIGCVRLVDLGLKAYVFRDADSFEIYTRPVPVESDSKLSTNSAYLNPEYDPEIPRRELSRQRQRTVAEAFAMIIVGVPLYLYHWKQIKLDSLKSQVRKK